MVTFEGYERRIAQIEKCMKEYGFGSLEEVKQYTVDKGLDVDGIVRGIQPIAFENAIWAYTLGAAIALKKGCRKASDAAEAIGIGLQAFCIPGSVAEQRLVGLGHGNLAAMLLEEKTRCFCFLAGHESFAAAEGAIGIAKTANKVRKENLQVILNGLGKNAPSQQDNQYNQQAKHCDVAQDGGKGYPNSAAVFCLASFPHQFACPSFENLSLRLFFHMAHCLPLWLKKRVHRLNAIRFILGTYTG